MRFNSPLIAGRFGMGLPNSSLGQARRVEVITWRKLKSVWRSYLDVYEIASGEMKFVPAPQRTNPKFAKTESGTIVVGRSAIVSNSKTKNLFSRKFANCLVVFSENTSGKGKKLSLAAKKVVPIDPLF